MLDNFQKPLSLNEVTANLALPKPDIFKAAQYPSLWKSLLSGKVRRLRFEGDFIYGETVLTEEQRKLGFDSYELKKDSVTLYKGLFQTGFTCSYPSAWDRSPQYNRCRLQTPIEFNSVSPNRIEGRLFAPPDDAKLDCKKCTYSRPSLWTPFTWIPE